MRLPLSSSAQVAVAVMLVLAIVYGAIPGAATQPSEQSPSIAEEFPQGITVESMVEATQPDVPTAPAALRLDRTTADDGWQSGELESTGPILIYVETGEITIVDELGIRGTYPANTQLVVPMGTRYSLANETAEPTAFLSLSLEHSMTSATPVMDGDVMASPVSGSASVAELLRADLATNPPSPVRLFIMRLNWEPGAALPGQTFSWPAGHVGVEGDLTVAGPAGIEGQIQPGNGIMFPEGLLNRARNAGSEPVVTLFAGMAGSDQPLMSFAENGFGGNPVSLESTQVATPDASAENQLPADTVPMLGGNAARTGEMPGPSPDGSQTIVWQIDVESPIRTSPVIADGVAIVKDSGGRLQALDVSSGETLWVSDSLGSPSTTPAVADGVVYSGGKSGLVTAIRLSDGEALWEFRTGSSYPIGSSPAVVDNVVYVASLGSVFALDASTGGVIWETQASSTIVDSPTVSDGLVYVQRSAPTGSSGALLALDATDGTEVWSFELEAPNNTVAVADGRLFVVEETGRVHALDAASGAEQWRFEIGAKGGASPAVSGGMVFVSGLDGILHALDAATGGEIWRFATGGERGAAPTVAGATVFVTSDSGYLFAVDAESGQEQWRFDIGEEATPATTILSSPAVLNGVVYVASGDSNVYAIGGSDGQFAVTPTPVPLAEGATASVVAEGAVLRAAPSAAGVAIAELPVGTVVNIDGPSEEREGQTWWFVTVAETGQTGYLSEKFLASNTI